MRMKILLFLVLVLLFGKSYSQDQELIKFNPEKKYTQKYMDSLIAELRLARYKKIEVSDFKKMLESDSSLKGWTYYYFGKCAVNLREKRYDSVLYYVDVGLEAFNALDNPTDSELQDALLLNNYKGDAYTHKKDYKNAIINYQNALDIERKHSYQFKSFIVSGIAGAHFQIGNDSLALKYYKETLEDTLYMSYPRAATLTLQRMGTLFYNNNKLDSAYYYLKKSIKINEIKDTYGGEAEKTDIYSGLGLIHDRKKNIDSALFYYKKAIGSNYTEGDAPFYVDLDNAKLHHKYYNAFVHLHQDSIALAKTNLLSLTNDIELIDHPSKNHKELMVLALDKLGIVYSREKNYEEYQNILNRNVNFLNRFHETQLNENLQQLETEYQTKQKDALIAQLEENKTQQETIIQQQRTIALGLGGLLVLLSGLGYLFWRQRKLKNQYEKENLEQRLLRSQMNPHFIGNAMNTVSALVNKQSKNAIPYITKLSNLFRLVLTNSREEFVSLEDELATLNSYLELQSNFSKDFDFSFLVDDNLDQEAIIIPPMLVQPFIENAILHGIMQNDTRGEVGIKITKSDKGLLLCEIEDNGAGYKKMERKSRKSVSGDIIRERLEIFKKKFKVNTRFSICNKKQGTLVELYLPYLIDS